MFANFPDYELYVTSALCVLALFGMGTTLTGQAFQGVMQRPRCLVVILLSQLVMGPLIAIGLCRFFHLPPGICIGLLVVTALPGGLFSNILALYAKASITLSVSATAVATLGSLVTTTFVLETFADEQSLVGLEMPAGQILFDIGFNLLFPLIAGMALRRHYPVQALPMGQWAVRGATVLMIYYIFASVQVGRIDLWAYGLPTHLSIILLVTLQSYGCNLISWIARMTVLERVTSQIEVVVRNVHLGLLLNASLFPVGSSVTNDLGAGVLFVLLYYGATSLIGGLMIVGVRRFDLYRLGDRHPGPPPPELRN